jgi:SAM-dependent methyltransferase
MVTEGGVQEPLRESAFIGWDAAPRLCPGDPAGRETCMWYHRVWQYLRLLDIISSTRTNSEFLVRALRDYARFGTHGRALVSCTADYSMLAHLRHAYDEAQASLDATVVDRCPTSVMLNRWYADRYAVRLTTATTDILEYEAEQPFDVICTHSLLARFDADGRRALVRHWHTMLRPGGVVITTQRIQPGSRKERSGFSAEEARAMSERAAAAARALPEPLEVSPEELAAAVHQYATGAGWGTYVITSAQALIDVFTSEGFALELADEGGGAEERRRDRPTITVGTDSYRMRIVARRL